MKLSIQCLKRVKLIHIFVFCRYMEDGDIQIDNSTMDNGNGHGIELGPTSILGSDKGTPTMRSVRRKLDFGGDSGILSEPRTPIGDMEKRYRETIGKYADRIYEEVKNTTSTYFSDVIRARDEREAREIIERLHFFADRTRYRRPLLLSLHDHHVHVVHACAYSNKSCKCAFIKQANVQPDKHRRFHARNLYNTLSHSELCRILEYFISQGRELLWAQTGGRMERLQSIFDDILSGGLSEQSGGETNSCFGEDDPELQRERQYLQTGGKGKAGADAVAGWSGDLRRKQPKKLHEKIQTILSENPCSPVISIFEQLVWCLNEDVNWLGPNSTVMKQALKNYIVRINNFTLEDFNVFYKNPNCKPLFQAKSGHFHELYYNVEDSVKILIKLIEYQTVDAKKFMLDFYNILTKKIPKCNTFCIKSPPSAGKNYFIDCFSSYLLLYGQFGNANKHNMFAFQEAPLKNIIIWNEPNYEACLTDLLKTILGGDPYNVNVKNECQRSVSRTPVIVMTNNIVPFMCDPSFADRIKTYTWEAAPFLKDYDKKPNPLAAFELLKHYGLVTENMVEVKNKE